MPDREKVITHLHIIRTWAEFTSECDLQFTVKHLKDIAKWTDDALALLKEQEAVEPIPPKDESDMWRCGNCNHQLFRCTHQRYCEMCGQAVKWE